MRGIVGSITKKPRLVSIVILLVILVAVAALIVFLNWKPVDSSASPSLHVSNHQRVSS